jgi:UDP-GlcNAc:undecaprenyl-phosphate GlcNAc-1-phosphate transferase
MLAFLVACFVPAFVVACLATAALRRLAPRWGLVDVPDARKNHRAPTPLGGGLGVWLGTLLPAVAVTGIALFWSDRPDALPAWFPAELAPHLPGLGHRAGALWSILGAATLLGVVGLLDDLRDLWWVPRLAVQACVAIGLVAGGVRATLFVSDPGFGAVASVLWLLVVTNAFNFLDNMDGLSGGLAAIASALFAAVLLVGTSEPRWFVAGLLLILCGATCGFLWHNRPPARIFLGDAGSWFLGTVLAAATLHGTFYEYPADATAAGPGRLVMFAPVCILAVPLYDFATVVLIRLRAGRSPFHADRNHVSHRLVARGMSSRAAVLTVHLLAVATGLGGLILYRTTDRTGALLVLGLEVCLLGVVALLEFAGRPES